VYGGLRRGELLALRWEDVDLDVGVIHVERSSNLRKRANAAWLRAGLEPIGLHE